MTLADAMTSTRRVVPDQRPKVLRLWLPLTLLFALMAPLALMAALLAYLAPPRVRGHPIRAALAIGQVLLSLGGTQVHVQSPYARIDLTII